MTHKKPTTPAFYKQVFDPEEHWFTAINWVKAPTYEIFVDNHEDYEFPFDGWEYHETPPQDYIDWWNENFSEEEEQSPLE